MGTDEEEEEEEDKTHSLFLCLSLVPSSDHYWLRFILLQKDTCSKDNGEQKRFLGLEALELTSGEEVDVDGGIQSRSFRQLDISGNESFFDPGKWVPDKP
jgi:hypothetical protein